MKTSIRWKKMYNLSKKMKELGFPEKQRREYVKGAFGFCSWPARAELYFDLKNISEEGLNGQGAVRALQEAHRERAEYMAQENQFSADFI